MFFPCSINGWEKCPSKDRTSSFANSSGCGLPGGAGRFLFLFLQWIMLIYPHLLFFFQSSQKLKNNLVHCKKNHLKKKIHFLILSGCTFLGIFHMYPWHCEYSHTPSSKDKMDFLCRKKVRIQFALRGGGQGRFCWVSSEGRGGCMPLSTEERPWKREEPETPALLGQHPPILQISSSLILPLGSPS